MKIGALFFWVGALSLFLSLFPSVSGYAEETKVYTLQESIDEALANNWKLRAKEEKIYQSRYIKNQARAEFLPKLSTSYGYRRDGWNPVLKSPNLVSSKSGP
ncbi:MAG: TolC family protein [Deltaproteobacteria bacterium]|nr:TolC family protein [Deltaproteobacteria bacterium]